MFLKRQSQATRALAVTCLFTIGAGSTFAASLKYVTNSSRKIEQVDGPCDWVNWDPITPPVVSRSGKVAYGTPRACGTTASQGYPNQILGHGLGYSFEDTATANLIVLFGDTLGVQSGVTLSPDPTDNQFLQFNAKDTIAASSTRTARQAFSLGFYTQPGAFPTPLFITSGGTKSELPPQPDMMQPSGVPNNTPVAMGVDDIANSGISIGGQAYLVVNTGADKTGSPTDPHWGAWSVLVKFDGVSTFTPGRTISQSHQIITNPPFNFVEIVPGHFVFTALYELPLAQSQQLGLNEPAILIYGTGQYRQSSLYLSYIPASQFWSGADANGKKATRYFRGYANDNVTPRWSSNEADAVPLVWDNPPTGLPANPDPGTIGNASVTYDFHTNLWLMTYDGGRQIDPATGKPSEKTTGVYFTYASAPWGPWLTPQLIYNACQAHSYGQGYGDFIFYTAANVTDPADNTCPGALPAGITYSPNFAGPAGPIIGTGLDPFGPDAFTTRGGPFAPEIIGRFTEVQGNTLKLFYNLSTWNPYAVVKMESDFTIR